jgi:hypothetical protein
MLLLALLGAHESTWADLVGVEVEATRPGGNVTWSRVRASPGCWFFSGPGHLGRDDHLGWLASVDAGARRVEVRFGPHAFRGPRVPELALVRETNPRHLGPWTVTETLDGKLTADGGFSGTYTYRECDRSGAEGCPNRCVIRAGVGIAP